jgi:proteic killer suppression protein
LIVNFKTKKLEKCYCQGKQAQKEFGNQIAKKYIQRVNFIKAAKNLDEVMSLPRLKCHPLKGNRKGQYAVKLSGFYRLIFTVDGDCLNVALIEEVSKHYDD